MPSLTAREPVLIVGAGIVGLTLGQALKKVILPKTYRGID